MKTISVSQLNPANSRSAEGISSADAPAILVFSPDIKSVSSNPDKSHKISSYPADESTQVLEHKQSDRKSPPGIFAQKISAEQRSTLLEWLADHTYDEVVELVAVEPPEGFGMKVGKSTLCRFHKANFSEIDKLRRKHMEVRSSMALPSHGDDYRAILRDAYSQLLLERLWELLSRPVQTADELKKLTVIAEKMRNLDRDKDFLAETKADQGAGEIDKIMAALRSRPGTGK